MMAGCAPPVEPSPSVCCWAQPSPWEPAVAGARLLLAGGGRATAAAHPAGALQRRLPAGDLDPGSRARPRLRVRARRAGLHLQHPDGLAHQRPGGFKVFRYVDDAGHVCAFYDSTPLFPPTCPTTSVVRGSARSCST